MNGLERLSGLAGLARREEAPAYAGDLCEQVWGRLHRPQRASATLTVTGFWFAAASTAAALAVWLYAGGSAEQSGLETIFMGYDPLYAITSLGGV